MGAPGSLEIRLAFVVGEKKFVKGKVGYPISSSRTLSLQDRATVLRAEDPSAPPFATILTPPWSWWIFASPPTRTDLPRKKIGVELEGISKRNRIADEQTRDYKFYILEPCLILQALSLVGVDLAHIRGNFLGTERKVTHKEATYVYTFVNVPVKYRRRLSASRSCNDDRKGHGRLSAVRKRANEQNAREDVCLKWKMRVARCTRAEARKEPHAQRLECITDTGN